MLIKRTLFRNEDMEKTAIDRLRAHEPPEGYWFANSGGKDSGVVEELLRRSGCKHESHHYLTTADPPELVYHLRSKPDIIIDKPAMTMWQLIPHKKIPPTRAIRYCCEHLKERRKKDRIVVTGVRWAESKRRSNRRMVESCFKDKTQIFVHPIIDWEDRDVWEYTKARKISYCSLYDEGFRRLGCILCPMQTRGGKKRDMKRWPKYKDAYIRAFDRMIEIRKEQGMQEGIIHWHSGEAVLDWWVNERDKKEKVAEGQIGIFTD